MLHQGVPNLQHGVHLEPQMLFAGAVQELLHLCHPSNLPETTLEAPHVSGAAVTLGSSGAWRSSYLDISTPKAFSSLELAAASLPSVVLVTSAFSFSKLFSLGFTIKNLDPSWLPPWLRGPRPARPGSAPQPWAWHWHRSPFCLSQTPRANTLAIGNPFEDSGPPANPPGDDCDILLKHHFHLSYQFQRSPHHSLPAREAFYEAQVLQELMRHLFSALGAALRPPRHEVFTQKATGMDIWLHSLLLELLMAWEVPGVVPRLLGSKSLGDSSQR